GSSATLKLSSIAPAARPTPTAGVRVASHRTSSTNSRSITPTASARRWIGWRVRRVPSSPVHVAMLLEMAADGLGERTALGSRDGGMTFANLAVGARRLGAYFAA